MIKQWDDLRYWSSGEWQVIEERIDDMIKAGENFCPFRQEMFNALDMCPFDKTKVMFMGQDPYPKREHACGLSFSVPPEVKDLPPSLKILLKEYVDDLHYDLPPNGDLRSWTKEGVLLWNAIPSCYEGKSWSHNWPEWKVLTMEIIDALAEKGIVFVFVGARARDFSNMPSLRGSNCRTIEVNHPSPRALITLKQRISTKAFPGSRIFTKINDSLVDLGLDAINWRLTCAPRISAESSKKGRGRVKLLVARNLLKSTQ
jgi:uracil-DNA glycosylase